MALNKISSLFLLAGGIVSLALSPEITMVHLPYSDRPIVLRTDFQNDSIWSKVCSEIQQPNEQFGFRANVEFLNDSAFENDTAELIWSDSTSLYSWSFLFIVDSITLSKAEHPILCIGLDKDKGKSFRVIPTEMWGVENNLSISNMDFEDFSNSTDPDGVFRGFR